ncbi:unnamed protein product [Symbiodinium natans]|uniref:Secreted protein n=1 Tax=Symbiodinium natans TaxID=878477 RepID=A0A812PNS8_9DINO|nr:unnamed protein product [Symbiodinium natans]
MLRLLLLALFKAVLKSVLRRLRATGLERSLQAVLGLQATGFSSFFRASSVRVTEVCLPAKRIKCPKPSVNTWNTYFRGKGPRRRQQFVRGLAIAHAHAHARAHAREVALLGLPCGA